ncbi:MAG: GAF domain-containing protein [Chloroflexi bacterium]|nr:GAF domain-containing protein [Chloroflexota bacterium]
MTISTVFSTQQTTTWQKFYKRMIAAHPSIESPVERAKAELQAALSLSFAVIVLLGLLATLQIVGFNLLVIVGFIFDGFSFVSYLISRSREYRRAPLVFVSGFILLSYAAVFLGAYPSLFLVLTFTILFLLANLFDLKQMAVIIVGNLIVILALSRLFLPQLQGQEALNTSAGTVTIGLFALLFAWYRDNLERLRLNEIRRAQAELEERNRALQQAQQEVSARLGEMRLAARVGAAVSQVRALDDLLADAVETIRERFDLYYAQVYLLDPARTHLVLESGSGEVGRQLKASNHRLPLDGASLNTRAVNERQTILVQDTAKSPAFKSNPLLPATRSEVSIPLKAGETVIGTLDLQSAQADAFYAENLPAFETLAGQIAIAIQNARLLEEAQQARAEAERAARRLVKRNWQDYLDALHKPESLSFVFAENQIQPLQESLPVSDETLTAPLELSGQPLGLLSVELPPESRTPQTAELLETVARQVTQHIESLRLLESAERYRAEAEEASRRLTREGWKDYMEGADDTLGYKYNLNEVVPVRDDAEAHENTLNIPLKVQGETIGKLAVLDADAIDSEARDLVKAVAERLSAHIEGLRLSRQTEQALGEAQSLYEIGQKITQSSDDTELLMATAAPAIAAGCSVAELFHIDEKDGQPELVTTVANWYREGDPLLPVGTKYRFSEAPSSKLLLSSPHAPLFISDTQTDERVDDFLRALWQSTSTASTVIIPLNSGGQWLGMAAFSWKERHVFSRQEQNIYTAISSLATPAIQSRRLLVSARQQAQREAMLNTINQKIQSATSVEAVLQIAARELGHALGAPMTVAQLTMKDSSS